MSLRVSGKGMEVGEALQSRITERCEQAVRKYFEGGYNGHLTVEKEGQSFKLTCMLHLSSGRNIMVDEKGADAYSTFETLAEHLEKKMRRYKRKLKDHHKHSRKAHPAKQYVISAPSDEDVDHEESTEFEPLIVSEEANELPELSVGEAVMELDFSGETVLAFRRPGDTVVQIVHRRPDGHFGWIDTKAL